MWSLILMVPTLSTELEVRTIGSKKDTCVCMIRLDHVLKIYRIDHSRFNNYSNLDQGPQPALMKEICKSTMIHEKSSDP